MIILDTDVCIEILRGNERVLRRRELSDDIVGTSFVTAAELFYGAHKSVSPDRNLLLARDFLSTLPIIHSNLKIAEEFGRQKSSLRHSNKLLPDADILVAATALTVGAVLVTGNVKHFDRFSGLTIVDWIRGK